MAYNKFDDFLFGRNDERNSHNNESNRQHVSAKDSRQIKKRVLELVIYRHLYIPF